MDRSFFELKYSILDSFYMEFVLNKHSIGESVGITYYSLYGNEMPKNIEAIVMKSTLMQLYLKHGGKITDYDKKNLKQLIDLDKKIDAKSQLTENEFKYYKVDIEFIKNVYDNLKKLD